MKNKPILKKQIGYCLIKFTNLLAIVSIAGTFASRINNYVVDDKAEEMYENICASHVVSEDFLEKQHAMISDAEIKFENGEIDKTKYTELLSKATSKDTVFQSARESHLFDEEFKAYDKAVADAAKSLTWSYIGCGTALASFVTSLATLKKENELKNEIEYQKYLKTRFQYNTDSIEK
ncbi:MAG: hypothetical protein J6K39_00675 [Clostridia bacterium]|nr:hypothetical protein [Clostridia bacterium]